jgi:hypothetical protein
MSRIWASNIGKKYQTLSILVFLFTNAYRHTMFNSVNCRQPVAANNSNTRTLPFGHRQNVWLAEARYGGAAAVLRAATSLIGTEQLPAYRMDECSWPPNYVNLKMPPFSAFTSQPSTMYCKFPGFHGRCCPNDNLQRVCTVQNDRFRHFGGICCLHVLLSTWNKFRRREKNMVAGSLEMSTYHSTVH